MALAAGVVVRDQYPDRFLDAHVALFAARHDEGLDLRVPEVVAGVLDGVGVPGDEVIAEIESGAPIKEIRRAHEQAVNDWSGLRRPDLRGRRAGRVRTPHEPAPPATPPWPAARSRA